MQAKSQDAESDSSALDLLLVESFFDVCTDTINPMTDQWFPTTVCTTPVGVAALSGSTAALAALLEEAWRLDGDAASMCKSVPTAVSLARGVVAMEAPHLSLVQVRHTVVAVDCCCIAAYRYPVLLQTPVLFVWLFIFVCLFVCLLLCVNCC